MNLAILCYDDNTSTWSAEFDGQVLVKSVGGESSKQYVISRINEGKCSKAIRLNVIGFSNLGKLAFIGNPISETISKVYTPRVKPNNQLTVAERFELLDECVEIAITASGIRSLIITGEGSVGKTFHTKEKIRAHGLVSTEEAQKIAHTLLPDEQLVAAAIVKRVNEVRLQVLEYYKEHGLPKGKSNKNDDDEEDDGPDDEFEMIIGKVNFTSLHTSPDIKKRACAGTYQPGTHNYEFNIKLAMDNTIEFLEIVVPHEMAHHVQYLLHPTTMKVKEGHGKEWRAIMKNVMGIPSDRFHRMCVDNVRAAPDLAGDYHYIKGYSSAKGLFRTLFENKKKIVIFDDCDAAWKNEVGAQLLKAALDSDAERYVTWNVESSVNDDLPRRFLFEGKVIFISNVKSEDFPQPLISRALRCDVELTVDERFERMRQILPSPLFAVGIPMEIRQMAFDFLLEHRDDAAEISTRSLLNICEVANTGSKLWKRIALSNIS